MGVSNLFWSVTLGVTSERECVASACGCVALDDRVSHLQCVGLPILFYPGVRVVARSAGQQRASIYSNSKAETMACSLEISRLSPSPANGLLLKSITMLSEKSRKPCSAISGLVRPAKAVRKKERNELQRCTIWPNTAMSFLKNASFASLLCESVNYVKLQMLVLLEVPFNERLLQNLNSASAWALYSSIMLSGNQDEDLCWVMGDLRRLMW
ncbi:hypothetical protein B0H14DRAFT_3560874 [Mycena olivaceomarginata]|nr:hypothetical protein B0H14DRAFT_3560874 [Mycena olivaceomarginata]